MVARWRAAAACRDRADGAADRGDGWAVRGQLLVVAAEWVVRGLLGSRFG